MKSSRSYMSILALLQVGKLTYRISALISTCEGKHPHDGSSARYAAGDGDREDVLIGMWPHADRLCEERGTQEETEGAEHH